MNEKNNFVLESQCLKNTSECKEKPILIHSYLSKSFSINSEPFIINQYNHNGVQPENEDNYIYVTSKWLRFMNLESNGTKENVKTSLITNFLS